MKYLLLCISIFIPIQVFGKTNYTSLVLSGSRFSQVFQLDINASMPRWMGFVNDEVRLVTVDRTRYILNYKKGEYPTLSRIKAIPPPERSFTDRYGNFFELVERELRCTPGDQPRYTRPININTKPGWIITFLVQDFNNGVVYLISSSPSGNIHDGKLFSLKTSKNFSKIPKPVIAEQSDVNDITYMAVEQKTGNLAFAFRHDNKHLGIEVFKREIDDVESVGEDIESSSLSNVTDGDADSRYDRASFSKLNDLAKLKTTTESFKPTKNNTELVNPRRTVPTTTEMWTTKQTNITTNELMASNKLLGILKDIKQSILGNLLKLQIFYERDRNYCQNTEKKYEHLLKRYIRTLELTEPEETEMRKNYTPDIKLKSFEEDIRKLIDTSITNLNQALLDVLEDTPDTNVNIEDL